MLRKLWGAAVDGVLEAQTFDDFADGRALTAKEDNLVVLAPALKRTVTHRECYLLRL